MADANDDREPLHTLKNQLAIIVGFSELVLSEMAQDNPHRKDVTEILAAARAALAQVDSLSR